MFENFVALRYDGKINTHGQWQEEEDRGTIAITQMVVSTLTPFLSLTISVEFADAVLMPNI